MAKISKVRNVDVIFTVFGLASPPETTSRGPNPCPGATVLHWKTHRIGLQQKKQDKTVSMHWLKIGV